MKTLRERTNCGFKAYLSHVRTRGQQSFACRVRAPYRLQWPSGIDGGGRMQTVASVPWERDYDAALERATSERKFVLLDIFNPG